MRNNSMKIKIVPLFAALAGLSLVVGCNKSSDTDRSAMEATNNNSAFATRQENNNLTPTSRETNTSSRVYSGDTNSAYNKEPDNTGRNVRDRSTNALTSGDQGGSESDREMTRQIRRAINSNDQLSTTAKNIKIITVNGQVTLRGPVNSEQEQKTIATIAQGITGVTSLNNQLEVKTTNQ
jgi:hyperosmotically inducible protein